MTKYVDLHCHSTFSTLDGLGTPKQVVERAKQLKWEAVCLTEHGWIGSAPALYKAAIENGIKPILGCEFYVVPDDVLGNNSKDTRRNYHLTVLALSKEGYENLVAWNTFSMQKPNFYYKPRISIEAMAEQAPHPLHHNVVLSGCLGGELCGMLQEADNGTDWLTIAGSYVAGVRSLFSNFFIEIQDHAIEKFVGRDFDAYDALLTRERRVRQRLLKIASATGTPIIATNDSHFQSVSQRKTHISLRAASWRHRDDSHYGQSDAHEIAGFLKDYVYFGNYMRNMEVVADGLPSEALESIAEIVKESRIRLPALDDFSYSIPFSGETNTNRAIRRISRDRLARAEANHGKAATERFEFELESMGEFGHYLILMSNFISAAREQGILTNTRGSAANSFLCYTLGIHDVDSIQYGLIFSRFFNPARKKFPDIDIDIEKDRHADFMQIVNTKMEELEGEGQVVPICNLGTYANRAAFRMAASSLGMSKEEQDDISKLLPQMIDSGMVEEEGDVYEVLREQYPDLYEIASTVFDSVKSVGQHACGYLFGTKERPIEEWVPLYFIASSGSLVTQYDLKSLDDFGLVKGDFLRLRTLSVIKRCLALLGKSPLDLEQIPLDDKNTFEMLREGRTEGIFTLQGKENRRGCMEVRVENVHDVIASVALYRPALTRVGLHTVFNNRRHKTEEANYPHQLAEEILTPTYGVPVFQEQAMELGYAVGMTDAEVDDIYQAIKLSKGVGRHAKAAFAKIKPKFIKRALKLMTEEEAENVWNALVAFQGYGFNKGHATSYGILAVRAAYLRANHPAEFFTALLDVYPERHKYIAAARSEGFRFIGPSINDSNAGFTFDRRTGKIRVGLARVGGLGPKTVDEIIRNQPFASFDDLVERTTKRALNSKRLETLIRIGALECVGVKGEGTDEAELEILGFCLGKPRIFKNVKPLFTNKRNRGGWNHRGRDRSVELTEGRSSVSKLFWIPSNSKLELKASAWARMNSYLLDVVDENGIPFDIIVPEDKEWDAKVIKYLHSHCKGKVLCLDGAIRSPFLQDRPQGFRLYNVTGREDPQIFGVDEKVKEVVKAAMKMKWMEKKNAAQVA